MKKCSRASKRSLVQLAAAAAVVLAALQLAACGKYTEQEITITAAVTEEETTLPPINISGGNETEAYEAPAGDPQAEVPAGAGSGEINLQAEGAGAVDQSGAQAMGQEYVLEEALAESDDFFRQSGMMREEAGAYVKTFVGAVTSGDRESAAAMISYPRSVKTPSWEGTVNSAEEFLAYYDEIFTSDFRKKLEQTSGDDLFCRNGLISSGDGSLWFYPATESDDMSVCTVNAAEDRYVRYGGPSGVQPG